MKRKTLATAETLTPANADPLITNPPIPAVPKTGLVVETDSGKVKVLKTVTLWKKVEAYDKRSSKWLFMGEVAVDNRQTPLRTILLLLEYSGHGIPWFLGSALLLYYAKTKFWSEFAVALAIALVLDISVVGILKAITRRQRPVYNVNDMIATMSVDKYSFPSGHTTRATLLTCMFVFMYHFPHPAILFGWVICMAISRVVLGRHHVIDVLAGLVAGILMAVVMQHNQQHIEALAKVLLEHTHRFHEQL